jgi:hypothetical protein
VNNAQHKQIYVEAWRPFPNNPIWCCDFTDVNHEVYRPDLGGMVGYFSASQWPVWHKITGNTVTVTFVSNHSFTRAEAIQIAADIIAGKVRSFAIDLSLI